MFNHIEIHPHIHFVKPCVAVARINAENVLELINEGHSFDNIIQQYDTDLTKEDLHVCMNLNL